MRVSEEVADIIVALPSRDFLLFLEEIIIRKYWVRALELTWHLLVKEKEISQSEDRSASASFFIFIIGPAVRVVGSSLLLSRYSLPWLLKHCYSTWLFQVPSLLLLPQGLLTSVPNFVLIIPFLFFIELSHVLFLMIDCSVLHVLNFIQIKSYCLYSSTIAFLTNMCTAVISQSVMNMPQFFYPSCWWTVLAITNDTAMDILLPGAHFGFSNVLYIEAKKVGHRACMNHKFYSVTPNCIPVEPFSKSVYYNAPLLVGTDIKTLDIYYFKLLMFKFSWQLLQSIPGRQQVNKLPKEPQSWFVAWMMQSTLSFFSPLNGLWPEFGFT